MTSSNLEDKISVLQARLKAENEAHGQDVFCTEPCNFPTGSRPGSGRRPDNLGNMGTPTRTRKHNFDFLRPNAYVPANDPAEVERKIQEIMKLTGTLTINGKKYYTDIDDLEFINELGSGTCGQVVKMLHRPSNAVIAVKQMRRSGNMEENKRIIMDLEVVLKSYDCEYIVQCLGCFINDAEVWISMELMATCFDKLLKRLASPIPEEILGKVAVATVKALNYLKEKHGVIHRDVKPSNILLDERGNVKLCDFGISGRLVDSKVKSKSAGCAAYMAPERIDPMNSGYDIRADVWSLGITLVELATGVFPYTDCKSDFEVLSRVLDQDPPQLPVNSKFSTQFRLFVNSCLVKDYQHRPKYNKLLEHQFIRYYEHKHVDVASWYASVTRNNHRPTSRSTSSSKASEVKCNSSGRMPEWDKFKGVWNSLLKSPLFRRKKSTDQSGGARSPSPSHQTSPGPVTQSQTQESPLFRRRTSHDHAYSSSSASTPTNSIPSAFHNNNNTITTGSVRQRDLPCGNISPIVLERFVHQQIQHRNGYGRRTHRSTSVSPTRRYGSSLERYEDSYLGDNQGFVRGSEFRSSVGAQSHSGRVCSPSPEPPPRINKMVSPLLMRRIAYNQTLGSSGYGFDQYSYHPPPPGNFLNESPVFSRRYADEGIPPQPPPRRRLSETSSSSSVPCSPMMSHRQLYPASRLYWPPQSHY